jgi:hypothetical protein
MAGRKLRGTVLIASTTSPSAALSGQRVPSVRGTPQAGQVSACSRRCSVKRQSTLVQSTARVAAAAARMWSSSETFLTVPGCPWPSASRVSGPSSSLSRKRDALAACLCWCSRSLPSVQCTARCKGSSPGLLHRRQACSAPTAKLGGALRPTVSGEAFRPVPFCCGRRRPSPPPAPRAGDCGAGLAPEECCQRADVGPPPPRTRAGALVLPAGRMSRGASTRVPSASLASDSSSL